MIRKEISLEVIEMERRELGEKQLTIQQQSAMNSKGDTDR